MKLSSFLVSILLVSLVVTSLSAYFSGIADSYPVEYSNNTSSAITTFDHFETIQETTVSLNTTLFSSPTGDSGNTELVGKFLGSGFTAAKLVGQSFTAFYNIVTDGIALIPGVNGFVADILVMIGLVIFLFIIVSVAVGRDV